MKLLLLCALGAALTALASGDVGWKLRRRTKQMVNMTRDLTSTEIKNLEPRGDGECKGKEKPHPDAGKSELDSKVDGQIVGGKLATRGQWPWQVAVVQDNSWFCGGSLVSTLWVLTAGHCSYKIKKYVLYLGAQNLGASEAGRLVLTSTTAKLHAGYNDNTLANDIAAVKLPSAVKLPNQYINTVRLPSRAQEKLTFAGLDATASGWGLTSDNAQKTSNTLNWVVRKVITNAECARYYGTTELFSYTICTTGAGGPNICSGDSGGPLVVKEADGKYTLVGIVSFGSSDSCSNGAPSGYTRVTSFLSWISSTTGIAIATK